MVYVHIGSVLILPESMSQSLIVAGTSGDNIGMCHVLREYQHTTNVNIHHVLCDPYLVSFPFYIYNPYMPLS